MEIDKVNIFFSHANRRPQLPRPVVAYELIRQNMKRFCFFAFAPGFHLVSRTLGHERVDLQYFRQTKQEEIGQRAAGGMKAHGRVAESITSHLVSDIGNSTHHISEAVVSLTDDVREMMTKVRS